MTVSRTLKVQLQCKPELALGTLGAGDLRIAAQICDLPAALRVADVTVAPGLLNAGVLDTLKASARNCSLKRSVIGKSRKMLASRLVDARSAQNVAAGVAEAHSRYRHESSRVEVASCRGRHRPESALRVSPDRRSACRWPAFRLVPAEATVNGVPVHLLKIPFICQLPRSGRHALIGIACPSEWQRVNAIDLEVVRAVKAGSRTVAVPHVGRVPGQRGIVVIGK